MSKRRDITGQRFNSLTAIKHVEGRRWEFLCDCGNSAVLLANNVTYGHTKSCGCLRTGRGLGASLRGLCSGSREDVPFFDRLAWDGRPISKWAAQYDTTPAEIMQRLKRDKTLGEKK